MHKNVATFGVAVLCGAILPALLAQEARASAPFYWVVTKGFSTSPGNGYGREVYALNSDGSGGLIPLYAPSGLPADRIIWKPLFRQNSVLFKVDWPGVPSNGYIYSGSIGNDAITNIASSYAGGMPDGAMCWVPGQSKVLLGYVDTGISKMDLNPATNDEVILTSNYFDEVEAIRSDNLTVYFSNAMYRSGAKIFTMNLNGGNIQPFDPFPDETFGRTPALSPDNSTLAVTRTGNQGIWLANASTGALITPISQPLVSGVPDYGENNGWMAWSPDSQTLAYSLNNQLFTVPITGGQPTQITSGSFSDLRVWGTAPYHAGDANHDGHVNVDDLGILASNYDGTGKRWDQGDFTTDGIVNVDDLGILASNYNWAGPAGASIPEPATLSLLALGGLAMIRSRRN